MVGRADERLLDALGHLLAGSANLGLQPALRKALALAVTAREEQRRHIRREIHDGIGPLWRPRSTDRDGDGPAARRPGPGRIFTEAPPPAEEPRSSTSALWWKEPPTGACWVPVQWASWILELRRPVADAQPVTECWTPMECSRTHRLRIEQAPQRALLTLLAGRDLYGACVVVEIDQRPTLRL